MKMTSHTIESSCRVSVLSKLLQGAVKLYQKWISPLKGHPCCRFYPSCSQYALDALSSYGAVRGVAMSVWRVMRCNPFCKGGFDPVVKKATSFDR